MIMMVEEAKETARRWIREEAHHIPRLWGAFLHGSINWMPDDAGFPPDSDLDIMLVLDDSDPGLKLGKFRYNGLLLEVSHMAKDEIQPAEKALGMYHLAGSLRAPTILYDPSGELSRIQKEVAEGFARRRWVEKRCRHAVEKILQGCRLDSAAPFPDQVNAWLFPTGITTHVLLTAGLRNPTVRKRYLAVRSLLSEYGLLALYEELLELLGCAQLTRLQVESHLVGLAKAFDTAKQVQRTPFFFSSDLTDAARPIVIDGSRKLIEEGSHREAVFWMAATYVRCLKVLACDGSAAEYQEADGGFRRFLADLGIEGTADLKARIEELKAALPKVWQAAEAIMDANPEIED
jgi:hypothetical protein